MKEIKAYRGYTRSILFNFSLKGIDSLDGYDAVFVVKRADDVNTNLIEVTAPVSDQQAQIEITDKQNDLSENEYAAAIYVTNGSKSYPADKYIYKIENFI